MTDKTAKQEMLQAHEAIAAALDAKLKDMPEWKAFRHIDRALLALDQAPAPAPKNDHWKRRARETAAADANAVAGNYVAYMTLADQALRQANKPLTTLEIVAYVGKHRPLSDGTRSVVQSSLSKDNRFDSVPYGGARAWWFAGQPIPS